MKVKTTYNTKQANRNLSLILNPKETQEEKNNRINGEVLSEVFKWVNV